MFGKGTNQQVWGELSDGIWFTRSARRFWGAQQRSGKVLIIHPSVGLSERLQMKAGVSSGNQMSSPRILTPSMVTSKEPAMGGRPSGPFRRRQRPTRLLWAAAAAAKFNGTRKIIIANWTRLIGVCVSVGQFGRSNFDMTNRRVTPT